MHTPARSTESPCVSLPQLYHVVDDVLGLARKLGAQLGVLGCNSNRASIRMALAHHDAAWAAGRGGERGGDGTRVRRYSSSLSSAHSVCSLLSHTPLNVPRWAPIVRMPVTIPAFAPNTPPLLQPSRACNRSQQARGGSRRRSTPSGTTELAGSRSRGPGDLLKHRPYSPPPKAHPQLLYKLQGATYERRSTASRASRPQARASAASPSVMSGAVAKPNSSAPSAHCGWRAS
jgi:hypothetical protein